jgi:hypothetical protein
MGTLEDVDVESIVECLTIYSTSTFLHKKSMTSLSRSEYEGRHDQFIQRICSELERFKEMPAYSLEERLPKGGGSAEGFHHHHHQGSPRLHPSRPSTASWLRHTPKTSWSGSS